MSNEIITVNTGFYTANLKILFVQCEITKTGTIYNRNESDFYQIIYIQKGNLKYISKGHSVDLTPGDILIAQPFEDYYLVGLAEQRFYNYVKISFHQNFFNDIKGDENYLRAFNDRMKGTNNIYRKNEFTDFSIKKCIIDSLRKYTDKNLGLVHFTSAVGMLITNITFLFDKKNNYIPSISSDEYRLKIYDYILRNYCSDISVKQISEKFSVSNWYVNKTTQTFYGQSFHETIKSLRMWNSKELMKTNSDLKEISSMCGYKDYSGFYRCYLKYFNVSPKEDLNHLKNTGIFLSHDYRY